MGLVVEDHGGKFWMENTRTNERAGLSRVNICLIGSYPPRECGIATFTRDLRNAISEPEGKVESTIIAVTNTPRSYVYPSEVVFEIRQNQLTDYRLAAEYINFSGCDAVCLQHEFGLFGGSEGGYITELLKNLRKPVVTTFHTVSREPEEGYKKTLVRIASHSDRLVVLNSKAIPMLRDAYGIDEDKISVIHHGVPDVPFVDSNFYKDKFGVEGRFVLLTFGLLSRNKGIELMLDALPKVIEKHPEVVYMVLGETHPEVKRRQGEEYRLSLQRKVIELGLEEHVIFYDRYVNNEELSEFISACDIYVTPYVSKEQIVSGTLAYAVGMGKAVVSTPYEYAEELLGDGRGRLVNFGDSLGLAETIDELIDDSGVRHTMRKRAYEYGRQMTWEEVGKRYLELFEGVVTGHDGQTVSRSPRIRTSVILPEAKLEHLIRLTDDTGIIQHAKMGIPDRRNGYSTDDIGRALAVAVRHYHQFEDEAAIKLVEKYLSFLQYAQLPDGRFHNFMDYSRHFSDEVGSEDTAGRALWGLGTAVALGHSEGVRALAASIFERSIEKLQLNHPRAIAYALCGLQAFLQRYDGAAVVKRKLVKFADKLAKVYERTRRKGWNWFGEELTYANAKLPQAMLLASQATDDDRFLEIGLESLDFLLSQTYMDNRFDFVGNQGWFKRNGERAVFGQQPIEAGYTAETLITAAEITGDSSYVDYARAAVEWIFGRNRLGASLYDFSTGGCSDGLDASGPSMNQGAESAICCVLGLLALSRYSERHLRTPARLIAASATAITPEI